MTRRGWCPSLLRPMPSGDGLLVRVRPPRGVLRIDAAVALAEAAAAFGNGTLQLTSRAAIQVRGLRAETVAPFAAAMRAAGLGSPGPVVWPPLLGDDPTIDDGAGDVAAAIERALANVALPGKFGVAVDGGGVLPAGGCPIVVRRDRARGWLAERRSATERPHAIGWHPYGRDRGAFGVGLPFGAMTAAMLADLAERLDMGDLRLTPWRTLLLTGPRAREVGEAADAFISDPDDPRARVFACPGAPACASASVPALADAALVAARGAAAVVHVSGCAKGCAHADAAPIVLVGCAGRYDLVRDGRAGDAPARRGMTLEEAFAEVSAAPGLRIPERSPLHGRSCTVMAGLDPAISSRPTNADAVRTMATARPNAADGRVKPGHDGDLVTTSGFGNARIEGASASP